MSEFDDALVSGEFAAYRETYALAVQPPGAAAVRATVRRRRRRTTAATVAAAVLAVAIPVGANAALNQSGPAPMPPAQTGEPAPAESPSAPTPSKGSPTPAGPDGRISRGQLLAAPVDLPAWLGKSLPVTCTSGNVRLAPETVPGSVPVLLGYPKHGDLDGDGAVETVALVGCRAGELMAKQLVAFDRDESGRIVTMGRIVGTSDQTVGATTRMDNITAFTVEASGHVRAEMGDIQVCCGTPEWLGRTQWRTYAWTGKRFDQTAGPTGFEADPRLTDLGVTAGDLVLGAPDGSGRRTGSLTITVTNKGPVDVPQVGFESLSSIGEPAGGDLSRCRTVATHGPEVCLLDGLKTGARRIYTFRFLLDPDEQPGRVRVTVGHFDAQDRHWPDPRPKDNSVDIRTAG